MKYLYNYNNRPCFYNGALSDIFEEELNKFERYKSLLIDEKGAHIKILLEDMYIHINKDRYFVSDLIGYKEYESYISIKMDRIESKEYKLKISDEEKLDKLLELLEHIIDSKEVSLNEYYTLQEELNKKYDYYNFKIRINNENVFYMYYGDFERMNKKEKIELIKLEKKDNNIYLNIKDNNFILSKILYPYLYNIDIDEVYCSNIELVSSLSNYYVDIDMDLLIRK